ncbi:MAG: endo-1,4-beta-xylanase [Nodosilinea sp.]
MNRRQFLNYGSRGFLVAHWLAQTNQTEALAIKSPPLTLEVARPDGTPLPADRLQRLYFLDLDDEPLPHPARTVQDGLLLSQPPPQWPVAVALQMPVDGFGDVTLYADNQGRGFGPGDFPLQLNRTFAQNRLYRVNTALAQWHRQGFEFPSSLINRLDLGLALLQQGDQADQSSTQLRLWNDALREGLWAGEEAAVSRAQQHIARTPPRQGFRLGCNAFGHPGLGADYDRYFAALFDVATVPLYWQPLEPEQGHPDYGQVDQQVNWLQDAGIVPKGHPLVWFHAVSIPDWVRPLPYHEVKASLRRRIVEITRRYGDLVPAYDVINEAHDVSWGNDLGYGPEQFIDLTAMACEAAREGNPQVTRIINSCCLWARNVAIYGPPQRSPYRYLQACLEANIPFEVIGLQLYYPDQDMFEIDRLLDRFTSLGKPIHITEMATASAPGVDPQSQLGEAPGLWHGPWSEALQADWVEQIYTLAYSKPEIEAVTWWDLSDQSTFWPFGGLLNRENQPKAAYFRLQELLKTWQLR